MKVKLQFGENPKRIINWWSSAKDFPPLVLYKNEKWEFVMYDEDDTGESEYVFMFSRVPSYDPNWHATTYVDIGHLISGGPGPVCQCGSEHGGGHMFFCPKWTKF